MIQREISDIKKVIVHCSDSPDSLDIGVSEIRGWHLERGFDDIGYHFVIRRDGSIEQGRPILFVGSHVKGQNQDSIGICLVGKKDFSQPQAAGLFKLYLKLQNDCKLDRSDWFCHNDFDKGKTCPNFSRSDLLDFISNSVRFMMFKGYSESLYDGIKWNHK